MTARDRICEQLPCPAVSALLDAFEHSVRANAAQRMMGFLREHGLRLDAELIDDFYQKPHVYAAKKPSSDKTGGTIGLRGQQVGRTQV